MKSFKNIYAVVMKLNQFFALHFFANDLYKTCLFDLIFRIITGCVYAVPIFRIITELDKVVPIFRNNRTSNFQDNNQNCLRCSIIQDNHRT